MLQYGSMNQVKLRNSFLTLFCLLALLPLVIFWLWPQSKVLQNEFAEVRDRHLLLARNLGRSLEHYYRDTSSVFNLLSLNLAKGQQIEQAEAILKNLGFRNICLADAISGRVIAEAGPVNAACPQIIPESQLKIFQALANENAPTFTEVMEGQQARSLIYIVRKIGDKIAVAALTTDYFVQLAKTISFGGLGHAVIVDHKGNVLAHPQDDWVAARRNIAQISAVQKIRNGEAGVDRFYSPALQSDVIAGFAAVAGAGWGVMIPQPVSELYKKAAVAEHEALAVFAAGFLVALILAAFVASYLTKPLEQLVEAARRLGRNDGFKKVDFKNSHLVPLEFREVGNSFNEMVERLQNAHKTVVQQERLATLGELTATVSHELRNPLGAIRTSIFLVKEKTKEMGAGIARSLDRAERNILRCDNIIRDLLDFASDPTTSTEQVDGDKWLMQVLSEIGKTPNVEITTDCNAPAIDLQIDQEQMRRVVINIQENAVQAMAECAEDKPRKFHVRTLAEGGFYKMIFEDTGPGMSAEVLARVFEPLFSTKSYGCGLGMPTVKKIVERYGGIIHLDSRIGKGTIVVISLPACELVEKAA